MRPGRSAGPPRLPSASASSSSSPSASPAGTRRTASGARRLKMGGCVTKGGAAGGLPQTSMDPAQQHNAPPAKDSSAATSPSTRLTEEPSPALAHPERRRLSLSQSDPARPDLPGATDSRGHLCIDNNTSGNLAAAASGIPPKQSDYAEEALDEELDGSEEDLNASMSSSEPEDDDDGAGSRHLGAQQQQQQQRVGTAAGAAKAPQKPALQAPVPANKQCRRLSVSGMPSSMLQDNFENKRQEVKSDTGYFDSSTLYSLGIGYACKKGLKPESPNQDDFFIVRIDDWGLYGVFDGHGPYGHDVSHYVQRELPKLVYNDPHFVTNPKEALKASFVTVHQMLENAAASHRLFDCSLSGCTATVLLHRKDKLYAAHVGDSRCVLGRLDKEGKIEAVDVTIDHKPNNEAEKKRIVASGGQVRRLDGDIPHRVFLKGKLYPGLAMSRAIGDSVGAQAGVICTPDVSEWDLTSGADQFITLCSDGVWEFLSSAEVANVIHRNGPKNVQASADAIARESWNRWIQEEGNVVDDITCEIIFLNLNKQ